MASLPPFRSLNILLLVTLTLSACTKRRALTSNLEINLYTGIPGFVRLGDTESQVAAKCEQYRCERHQPFPGSPLEKANITFLYHFKDLGIKAYFQRNQVSLIEIQDPFKGIIQNKRLAIFTLAPPPDTSWEGLLRREFGEPSARAAGGRLGSDALFFSWGDIAYNRQGPNEIALYRDPAVAAYRQKHFGRELRFFP